MSDIGQLFPETYEISRGRFRDRLAVIRQLWPDASLHSQALAEHPDCSIDWITAAPTEKRSKILVFTTGEHGIEGYTGSAVLEHFFRHYLERLNPADTGLLLVHAINPWGMKHWRRVNAHNVDLNRNFVYDPAELDPRFNPECARMDYFNNPAAPVSNYTRSRLALKLQIARHAQSQGMREFWKGLLLGQYANPQGLHYGATEYQEETALLMDLYRQTFRDYEQVLHLDMHTGYGPRYQMSLVNSAYETRSSAELAQRFDYPLVVAANPEEFYAIRGDMIDFVYRLRDREFPGKPLYATSFEFGTFGESEQAAVNSLAAMVFENRLYFHGVGEERQSVETLQRSNVITLRKESVRQVILDNFRELFAPVGHDWRRKALVDARQACEGILRAEGFLSE
jgi:predicted deacylase